MFAATKLSSIQLWHLKNGLLTLNLQEKCHDWSYPKWLHTIKCVQPYFLKVNMGNAIIQNTSFLQNQNIGIKFMDASTALWSEYATIAQGNEYVIGCHVASRVYSSYPFTYLIAVGRNRVNDLHSFYTEEDTLSDSSSFKLLTLSLTDANLIPRISSRDNNDQYYKTITDLSGTAICDMLITNRHGGNSGNTFLFMRNASTQITNAAKNTTVDFLTISFASQPPESYTIANASDGTSFYNYFGDF